MHRPTVLLLLFLILLSCTHKKEYEKGFTLQNNDTLQIEEDPNSKFIIQPGRVLATNNPDYKITPLLKLNYNSDSKKYFLGDTDFYRAYQEYNFDDEKRDKLNNWNENIVPGFRAAYGYNWMNISIFNTNKNLNKELFDTPVLIKTLYYPTSTADTLNGKPISRNYILVSVYDEDTNKDQKINTTDLRRLYLYKESGEMIKNIVPKNYNVFKSIYDKTSDYLYVYARLDENKNGKSEITEAIKVFYIDLKNPENIGKIY